MSERIIVSKRNQPFTCFPNFLINDLTLPADALACALYLYSKHEGWQTHPNDVCKRFKWGRHTWLKVAKELRERDMLISEHGYWGTTLIFRLDWEQQAMREPKKNVGDNSAA